MNLGGRDELNIKIIHRLNDQWRLRFLYDSTQMTSQTKTIIYIGQAVGSFKRGPSEKLLHQTDSNFDKKTIVTNVIVETKVTLLQWRHHSYFNWNVRQS